MTELQLRTQEINAIQLTPEEERYAILSAKAKKWHAKKNEEYWKDKEKGAYKDDEGPMMGKSY